MPALACVLIALAACQHDGRTLRPADPSQNASVFTPSTTTTIVDDSAQPVVTDVIDTAIDGPGASFVIHAPFADGGVIDAKYSCNAQALSPPISWTGAPANAVSMALVVIDTDFNNFVHWVIAGLAPKGPGILEGQVPVGAIEGANGASANAATTSVGGTTAPQDIGWRAMCPPKGATHHYRFTLYALDQQIDLPNGVPAADLMAVIDSSSIQAAQITGVYTTP
jgi:Raf kinase inhibitor-like YbhB/YbcL family protein